MSSDNRNAMLSILAETQKLMHQRRVQGLVRSADSAANTPSQSPTISALSTSSAFGDQKVRSLDYIGARDNRSDFFDTWSRTIDAFVNDSARTTLDLPAELDSNDRRVLHQLADKYNLGHTSVGKGPERHLVLKKDTLFYRAANKMVDHDAIEALKNKKEAAHGSRFHLRKANPNENLTIEGDEEGTEAEGGKRKDVQLEKALSALDRATNQYAYASDQAGTPLVGAPIVSEADKYLSHGGQQMQQLQSHSQSQQHQPRQGFAEVPTSWASAISGHKKAEVPTSSSTAILKDVTTYEEQCTSCGQSAPLDYAVSEWTCIGHCDTCKRDVVFRLVEKKRRVVVANEGSVPAMVGSKRPRDEEESEMNRKEFEASAAALPSPPPPPPPKAESIEREQPEHTLASVATPGQAMNVEEIDREDDDEEDLIPLEPSDLVAMLECNDHHASIVGWFSRFASGPLCSNADAIGARISFVMEFRDLSSKGPRVSVTGSEQKAATPPARFYLKLKGDAQAVTALLDEIWQNVFDSSTELVIGLPNISVAGIDLEIVLHGPASPNALMKATSIQSRVGSNRLVFGTSLQEVA